MLLKPIVFFNNSNLVQFVSSGPVIAMELMGDEAVSTWRKVLGPTESGVAQKMQRIVSEASLVPMALRMQDMGQTHWHLLHG